jgi:hypothetical protein
MGLENEKINLYTKNRAIVERKIDKAQLLVNPQTESIFHLNQMGSAIWRLLEHPTTVDEIINTVIVAFPESAEDLVKSDVQRIFRQFVKKNLILPVGHQATTTNT